MQRTDAILEAAVIPNGCNECGGGYRSDAFNSPKPLAQLAGAVQFLDPPIIRCDPAIELHQLALDLHNHHPDQRVKVIRHMSGDLGKSPSQLQMSRAMTMPCSARIPRI